MEPIKIAIAGVGNCASSLLQGIEYYRQNPKEDLLGLMHHKIAGYGPFDIQPVAAFDVDARKVDKPLHEAAFAPPNCTMRIVDEMPDYGVTVQMGPVLDGIASHMKEYPPERTFVPSDRPPCDVEAALRESGAEILLSYLPVGSEKAVRLYAQCCLNAGVSLVNCVPVFIVSDPEWEKRFRQRGIPVVGDDVKSQVGATIVHRTLTRLFEKRGVKLLRTYQLNTGGNTDFLNMKEHGRLKSKKISKTEAVQSQLKVPLPEENIHIGPSDYVPWQNDNKVCFIRMEGLGFAGVPLHLELRLSVEDSPNSGGVVIDAIRFCKLARIKGDAGALLPVSAYLMKHPPVQMPDGVARDCLDRYLEGEVTLAELNAAIRNGGDCGKPRAEVTTLG
ncbi:MAG: inositol-3-phosphate synthase [Candidatus Tectomicrobia bacterium]|nr:inositol-3-phosphate synthase [Candidatus Tectomicrobia bacterium]